MLWKDAIDMTERYFLSFEYLSKVAFTKDPVSNHVQLAVI